MANVASVSNLSQAGQDLLSIMIEQNPILRVAEFKPDTSEYNNYPDKLTATGSAARAEGAVVQSDAQVPDVEAASLALYGRGFTIDDVRKLDSRITGSPNGLRLLIARRQKSLAKKLSTEVCNDMTAGTNAANRMLGMTTFIKDAAAGGQTAVLGFTAAEQAAMLTQVELKIDNVDDQDAFCELLDMELAKVPGVNAIIMNGNLKARMNTIARRKQLAGQGFDQFGQPVDTYNTIPLIPVTTTGIPQTETDGVNNDCTSIYIVRFAEDLGVSFSTNSGFYFRNFDEINSYPAGKCDLQFFLNLTVDCLDGIRRLSRIRL